ncbi:chemotaxis protein CheB [Vitiosangium sp. GDMCC 1.1324]|uniref:chemotaxis protein CheB n=1 Tax=Vitiosangium sp. (strain GDMCC 1.1324) TaxID=2138576 RepID=UPI000D3A5227|nr:chemotaxis protein CheB [Vitiosangium sp. GDMCC 1.1324]PTL76655.1 chemotaxis response regulator protein-glutamate methylesterase [Vitiosangium sp. GDMCC 1.1324]
MKLLLVEDSRSVVAFLEQILRREPDIELLPPVGNGREAVAAVQRWNPQLVLMDLVLPGGMDGVDAITEIMSTAPCPIVVLSGQLDTPGRDRTFESLRAGAVDVLAKPTAGGLEAVKEFRERLLRTVRVMAHARVVGRRRTSLRVPVVQPVLSSPVAAPVVDARPCSLLAIGGSTGAPPLVYELLRALPVPAPFPVVVAQHIVRGFEPGFARWLGGTGHRTVAAQGGEWLEPGAVYVSPADRDLTVRGGRLQTQPSRGVAVPSVDVLFESVAGFHGARAVGLLLTGMGEDGARGLLAMRQAGALTVAQEGSSCVVDGMPGAARALGAACQVLTPGEMGSLLTSLARASSPLSGRGTPP